MAYTQQSPAAAQNTPPGNAFASVFESMLGAGTDIATNILRTKGEQYLSKVAGNKAVSNQANYDALARSSPALGPNDVSGARNQAKAQTSLLTGIIPEKGNPVWLTIGFAIAAVALVIFVWKTRK
jgi:hypothetical protein